MVSFDNTDLVQTFIAGEYEDLIDGNSTWAEGDWDGDGDFTSNDIVLAFIDGGYTFGAAVPEPSALMLFSLGGMLTAIVGGERDMRKRHQTLRKTTRNAMLLFANVY